MNRTIAPQPGEQACLLDGVRPFAAAHGAAVLYTTNGRHNPKGYHPRGQAADLAALAGPQRNSPELLRINLAAVEQIPAPYIAELLYGGPGGICMKNGTRNYPSAELLRAHEDHMHLAVTLDYRYEGATTMDDDDDDVIPLIAAFPYEDGYVLVAADGATYCFNCQHRGGLRWDGHGWVVR